MTHYNRLLNLIKRITLLKGGEKTDSFLRNLDLIQILRKGAEYADCIMT